MPRTNSDNEDSSGQSDSGSIDNVSNFIVMLNSSNGSFSTTTSALMIKVNQGGITPLQRTPAD